MAPAPRNKGARFTFAIVHERIDFSWPAAICMTRHQRLDRCTITFFVVFAQRLERPSLRERRGRALRASKDGVFGPYGLYQLVEFVPSRY